MPQFAHAYSNTGRGQHHRRDVQLLIHQYQPLDDLTSNQYDRLVTYC
jgi:hypothetical protein